MGLKLLLEETTETLLSPAVALSVKAVDGSNFQETFFSISDPSNVQVWQDYSSLFYLHYEFYKPYIKTLIQFGEVLAVGYWLFKSYFTADAEFYVQGL